MTTQANKRQFNMDDLRKKIAESGTTVGLSRYEDKPIKIRDFFFTKNEDDGRDVVEFILDNGQHIRSGGQLVMTSFRKVKENFDNFSMTMEDIYTQGFVLRAVFTQQPSQKIGRQPYWTVVLDVVAEAEFSG
jgi:hypothetical protein